MGHGGGGGGVGSIAAQIYDPANLSGNQNGTGPFSDTSNDNNPLNAIDHLFTPGSSNDTTTNDLLRAKYQQDRNGILNDAFKDATIDDISRKEIQQLRDAGGTNTQLKTLVDAARAGKGIYAVRKVDQAQRNIVADMPGRRQLSPTYGR
jgi:hypothetical protein